MTGETNLNTLLASMSPKLNKVEYVFCTLAKGEVADLEALSPLATFMEEEGLTLVLTKDTADKAQFNYEGLFKCITLHVHSSLEAVGLTAAVSTKLADKGISANVIAAYYHDHIFIPAQKADLALSALLEL
jgi:hypothetical protein